MTMPPYLDENGVAHVTPDAPPPLPIEERKVALHLLATCYLSQVRHPDPAALERAEREYLRFAKQCFPGE
ncbi:MAG: hypothetical protein MUE52_06660 [Tabrizicola sp.]|nr:hypothetical protein [Tabrizicola sp.]